MTDWGDWRTGSPDWYDDVNPIQFKKADGTIITATGGYIGAGFDGEAAYPDSDEEDGFDAEDEYPYPEGFIDESGCEVFFYDFTEWRVKV